jgi:hypothetical protein
MIRAMQFLGNTWRFEISSLLTDWAFEKGRQLRPATP